MRSILATAAAFGMAAILAAACSGGAPQATATPQPTEPEPASEGQLFEEFPLLKGPVSPDGTQAIFATTDLSPGPHRIAFVLTSQEGLVSAPVARVSSSFYPSQDSEPQPGETALATFRQWPHVARGTYTTQLTFDVPGRWGIDIVALDTDGPPRQAQLFFEVGQELATPNVGDPAVPSRNKTLADVEDIGELTTGSLQDPDLYQTTIAAAVDSGLPTVVVMASPAFCTNAVCGPQVDVLKELKDLYRDQANFIHVDFYDNPDEIQGDLSRARLSPTVVEWNLPSAEWSFVIDVNGTVVARFEGFATLGELEQTLVDLL